MYDGCPLRRISRTGIPPGCKGGETSERDDVLLGAYGAQCTAYRRTTKSVRVTSGL